VLQDLGEHGQANLAATRVCLLNASATGSEALKNLVLGGVGEFTVVDGAKVEAHDLGNNFLVDADSLGRPRAQVVCDFLPGYRIDFLWGVLGAQPLDFHWFGAKKLQSLRF